MDCHDAESKKGGLDLSVFKDDASVLRQRNFWGSVYEKVESHQMPPPKRQAQPTESERAQLLAFVHGIAARPDPALGAPDPGRPILRRLTRLEYNNTVRDLLDLETDLFMFPERLPLAGKDYFQPASGKLGTEVRVTVREFGGKYPVLLPQSGLPGDNRAEHGYRNRGDAMSLSPLLLEKYFAVAGEIANHPELPRKSAAFARLLGQDPVTIAAPAVKKTETGSYVSAAVATLNSNRTISATASGSALSVEQFAAEAATAFAAGHGGIFDVSADLGNQVVPGKGGLITVPFGLDSRSVLQINPSIDLWLVAFSTATPTSGKLLVANKNNGEKTVELTLDVKSGGEEEGVVKLGLCILGRRGQSGPAKVTAVLSDGTEQTITIDIREGAGSNVFCSFAAHVGETIKRVGIDGSAIQGDYLLLDDIGFITNGKPQPPKAVRPTSQPASVAVQIPVPAITPQTRPAGPPRDRLAQFMTRAFRRPATGEELDRYFRVFSEARAAGGSEQEAMRATVQAVLASSSFLYLAEPHDPRAGPVRPLSDFELASRLSYFLWATSPDEELLRLAGTGKLADPAGLEQQARRMLHSPRSRELSESFATQWLRLDQLSMAQPDRGLFKPFYSGPQGKDTLHGAMLVEALLLFETVMVEDRSILDFVDSQYTWLNPRLAAVYGISLNASGEGGDAPQIAGQANREVKKDPKAGNTWRRTQLKDKTRGGFMTMAGPLTVTSLPFRTSPVKRGAWILETMFNRPPTEPKVAFALKDDTKEAAAAMSVRQKFEAHRSNAACYSCHIRLDPPGFALEPFDAIGAWRTNDGPLPIDSKAEWNGRPFEGPAGFKEAMAVRPEEFVRGFTEHLLSYALGRKLEIYDMPTVDAICISAAADGYRFSRIVVEIVRSYPFRNVRNIDLGSEPQQEPK